MFEWQTEEDNWEDEPLEIEEAPKPAARPRWHTLSYLLLVVIILAAGGTVIMREINQRVDEATSRVEQEVRASHRLVREAANERDYELLVRVLSGHDSDWVAIQRDLLRNGQFFDRPALGLYLSRAQEEPNSIEVTVSPDLTAADVIITDTYVIEVGNGVTESVRLQQQAIYRLGPVPGQWLYAPPLEPPVPNYSIHEGAYLTLIAPAADEQLVARLARDISSKMAEMCATIADLSCPPGYHRVVRLDPDPESLALNGSLAELTNQGTGFARGRNNNANTAGRSVEIRLPAPELVGRPVDEAGYQALYRGYAGYIISVALLELWNWECCEQAPLVAALLEQTLAGLSLRPQPLTAQDYTLLLDEAISLPALSSLWDPTADPISPDQLRRAHALLAFMRSESERPSVSALLQSFHPPRGNDAPPDFWQWVRDNGPRRNSDSELAVAWLDFLYTRSTYTRAEPPPLPEQELLLICEQRPGQLGAPLYRFSPAALWDETGDAGEIWTTALPGRHFSSLLPVPDLGQVLLLETSEQTATLSRWDGQGEPQPLWEWPNDSGAELAAASLENTFGGHLLVRLNLIGFSEQLYLFFSLRDCAAGACEPLSMDVFYLAAPDGEHRLQIGLAGTINGMAVVNAAGETVRQVDVGLAVGNPWYSVAWLDEQHFVYPRYDEQRNEELVLETVQGEEAVVLLHARDLLAAMPENARPDNNGNGRREILPHFITSFTSAYTPGNLAIFAAIPGDSQAHLFVWHSQTGELSWRASIARHAVEFGMLQSPQGAFSPTGDWLTVPTTSPASSFFGNSSIMLHHIPGGQSLPLPLRGLHPHIAWTTDGRWLAATEGNMLLLMAPDENYRRLFFFEEPTGCGPAGWISPATP